MAQCVGSGWKELWNSMLNTDRRVRRDRCRGGVALISQSYRNEQKVQDNII